jgi:hypothetical protein
VPTEDELVSLVDYSIAYPGPTINSSIFPATPSSSFWSSSPYADSLVDSWIVNFYNGYTFVSKRSDKRDARLVRGGCNKQPPARIVGVTIKGTDGNEHFINSNGSDID